MDSSIFSNTIVQALPDKIHSGESSQLQVIPSVIEYIYSWTPTEELSNPNISNPVAKPKATTTYYVTITSDIGCMHEDSVTTFILTDKCAEPYIFIPNAFTPGANQNNILFARGNVIESIYFAIYNRWGEKIFETTDINTGWDGTYKGKNVDPGVFDYYLEVTCFDKEKFKHKGNITLIR
jgi:gliding motility-associated-like protein